jgi:prepilin-type N-terminal cleavage/methylation domain-containing protein
MIRNPKARAVEVNSAEVKMRMKMNDRHTKDRKEFIRRLEQCILRPFPASGFTLVELLTAVSVLVIMGSAVYVVFNTALNVYQKSESRIVMAQKCRVALHLISTDLSNMQAAQGDESLVLVSQDQPMETGDPETMSRDMISFVTLIQTDPDAFLTQLNSQRQLQASSQRYEDEENVEQPVSDVQRVAYYIGPDPNQQTETFEGQSAMLSVDEEYENPVLLRIATTSLNPETVIQSLLEDGTIPEEDENQNPIYADIATIIDRVTSFDLKYFDGEDWYESWEDPEALPSSIQILITVATEDNISDQNTRANTMTQSTMIYLPTSTNVSEQPGGQGGGQ